MLAIASDSKRLGADIGFAAILHTWGQTLMDHPHVHCVVPGGGLSHDEQRWVSCRKGFFLPKAVLSRLFRRLFLEALKCAFDKDELEFHNDLGHLSDAASFQKLIRSCRKKEWVVYVKPPFGGPEKVLDYLGRYTHRIAISNHRLLEIKDGKVTFTWKNYRKDGRQETMTLEADEFIRRFLLHVLPSGFVRIRYYGLLAHCHRAKKLERCRELLDVFQPPCDRPKKRDWTEVLLALTGKDPLQCPKCERGRMVCVQTMESPSYPCSRSPPHFASR
jgi:Putative transposase